MRLPWLMELTFKRNNISMNRFVLGVQRSCSQAQIWNGMLWLGRRRPMATGMNLILLFYGQAGP